MFIRRLFFSIIYFCFVLYALIFLDVKMYFILVPFIPFLFYIINILKIKVPMIYENIFLIFIMLAVIFGSMFDFYIKISYWDIILHTIAGFILCFIPLYIFIKNDVKISLLTKFLVVFFISMGLASFWEMIEYGLDVFLGLDSQKSIDEGVVDTMNDICVHALGSTIFIFVFYIDAVSNNILNNKVKKIIEKTY